MRMAEYIFPEQEGGSCGPHKSACTSSSLLVVTIMLLFCLTTWIDLLPTNSMHSLSRSSGFSALFSWQTAIIRTGSEAVRLLVFGISLSELESEALELSKLMNTLAVSYMLLEVSKLIPSVSLDALTTQALLACANFWCHTLMRLFQLTRWVGRPQPVIAIALLGFKLLITMATPAAASLRTNRFCSCFAYAMTFFSLINVIVVGSSWNNIPLSCSWPREMKFESHSGA